MTSESESENLEVATEAVIGPLPAAGAGAGAGMPSISAQHPSASYSITMRVRLRQRPGAFARVAGAIGETGSTLGAIDLVRVERGEVVRDVTVACSDAAHARQSPRPSGRWTA